MEIVYNNRLSCIIAIIQRIKMNYIELVKTVEGIKNNVRKLI